MTELTINSEILIVNTDDSVSSQKITDIVVQNDTIDICYYDSKL